MLAAAGFSYLVHSAFMGAEGVKGAISRTSDYGWTQKGVKIGLINWPIDEKSIIDCTVAGVMAPQSATTNMEYHGFKASTWNDEFFQHHKIQRGLDESMLGFQIFFDAGQIKKKWSPIDLPAWHAATLPQGDDILTLLNRGNIDEQTAYYWLQREGVRDWQVQDAMLSLRNEVPPVADLIRFAVRDAFFPDVIAAYGEADEYPSYIDKFIKWQGLGWETGQTAPASKDIDGNFVAEHPATWGEISWWAHWEFPSATQGYDMMFKLYEDSDYGPSPYVVDQFGNVDKSLVFSESDLNRLLRASAYSTYWRQKLAAIASQPINKGDLVRMLKQGLVDESIVYHTYRAQNYDDRTAKIYTEYTLNQQKPDIRKEVIKLFNLGAIDETGAIDRMKQFNVSEQEAQYEVYLSKLILSIHRLEERIKYVHTSVVDGRIDLEQGRTALTAMGLQGNRVNEYIQQWQAEIEVDQRILTLRQLQQYYLDGSIPDDDLIGRLQRLKYSDKDISAIMKHLRKKLDEETSKEEARTVKELEREQSQQEKASKQQAKEQAALQKSKQQQEKERNKAIATAEKQAAKSMSDASKAEQKRLRQEASLIAKGMTDKILQTLFKNGELNADDVRLRLYARGMGQSNVEKWIDTFIVKGIKVP